MRTVTGHICSFLLLSATLMLSGCRKEETGTSGREAGNDVYNWCYNEDSSCVMIPNFFSPNGDGINDRFNPCTYWIDSLRIIIWNAQMHRVFLSTDPYDMHAAWDGRSATGTDLSSGIYFYDVRGTSSSDREFHRVGHLHLVRDPFTDCIHHGCEVITGDMLDPRRCGQRLYPTNDRVQPC